ASPLPEMPEVVVRGRAEDLLGSATSASQGVVGGEDLQDLPLLRRGELLESVPGMVVTQHSGDGKANQYFLRGFNLDHGTDFAFSVDGVPVNLPTHAHGQGYSDLNFLIPELIERIDYRKGVYYAEEGDFSAAGAAAIRYRSSLDAPFLSATAGQEGYRRIVAANSGAAAAGEWLLGGEYARTEGPWELPEGYHRASGLAKYSRDDQALAYTLAAMGYDASWRATDQIPWRAVSAGLISRFGNIDPTDAGRSRRWSISGEVSGRAAAGTWRAQAYLLGYRL